MYFVVVIQGAFNIGEPRQMTPVTDLLGKKFIINHNKLRIISNNKEMKIKEYLITKGNIKIKKEVINSIIDMSYMFYKCESLISLPDISKWNNNNVTNLSYMLYCKSLKSLPDIS